MGKIIVPLSVSLDGFFEGPNREIDWHHVDEELHAFLNQQLGEMGAFWSGRVTYELMAEFWPTADQEPDAPPVMVEFAGIWKQMPKVVYSRTLEEAGWDTAIVREVVPDDIRAIKTESDRDIVLGGPDLATTFRRHGLIDEYWFYMNPVVIGAGRPVYPAGERVDLELIDTCAFGNGVVRLRYRPTRGPGARR
jgi:dihydrofolate reductase